MIHNDEQLALVRRQLGHLESAFRSLEKEIRPLSEIRFQLMSEAYVDEIAKLQREIDEYCATKRHANAVRGQSLVRKRRPA